jgi:hypothetical protein
MTTMTGGGDDYGGRCQTAMLTSCPPVLLLSAATVATVAAATATVATAAAVFAITLPLVVDCCLPLLFPAAATATSTVAATTAPVTIAVIHFLHLCLHCRRLHLQVRQCQRRTVAVGAMVWLVVDKVEARKGLF